MRVLEIKDLLKKDIPLYYRREFHGKAVFEVLADRHEKRIDFIVEKTPFGGTSIHVSFVDEVDYPIMPLMDSLKSYILDMEKKGGLP
jgi:hypothetical protein